MNRPERRLYQRMKTDLQHVDRGKLSTHWVCGYDLRRQLIAMGKLTPAEDVDEPAESNGRAVVKMDDVAHAMARQRMEANRG